MQLQPQPATLPLVTEPSSNSSSETCKTIRADQDEQINAAPTITDTDFFQMNHLNNSSSVNFKEFSSQLISQHFSQIQPTTQLTHDELIDNEMYKFVLNGKRNVALPPGFDLKEQREIEELGEKIAQFQIETDTEMSLFNTDTSSSTSESNSSESDDFDDNAGLKNLEKLNEIKKNRLQKTLKGSLGAGSKSNADSKSSSIKSSLNNAKQLVEILECQGLLSTIKVFCDWLLCNKKIIQSISQVSITMWSKLAILLNCIPSERQIACDFICSNEYVRNLINRSQITKSWNCQPMPEDVHLRSFTSLRLEHASLKFDINKLNQLSLYDEHLLRLCNLRRFGYMIASFSKTHSEEVLNFFDYDLSKSAFYAPLLEKPPIESTDQFKQTPETHTKSDRRVQLMKSMAQLRLEAEILQLESSAKSSDSVFQWSPYLVPDTLALCHSLKLIQELTRMNKFILIIPLIVIDNLDRMKKDSKLAREAIRWLENQFKQGNRFLRAQNQNEKVVSLQSNQFGAISKRRDADAWSFLQLCECCRYFQQENNDTNRQCMVTLLLSGESETQVKFEEDSFKSLLNSAKEDSIEVVNIREFYDKCKHF
jgi:protein SMG5